MYEDDFSEDEPYNENGSDELLSSDELRLPEGANILVRLHAARAWLTRRQRETTLDIGTAALHLQELQTTDTGHLRRREREAQAQKVEQAQHEFERHQQRLGAYEEAQSLLEECIDHVNGDRVLVEYYLQLEGLIHTRQEEKMTTSAWLEATVDVLQRIEHVSASSEE